YACYDVPAGLEQIAARIHLLTECLARGLRKLGSSTGEAPVFDTVRVELGGKAAAEIQRLAEARRMNFREIDEHTIGISLAETTSEKEVLDILRTFSNEVSFTVADLAREADTAYPPPLARSSSFLTHPVFNRYHS